MVLGFLCNRMIYARYSKNIKISRVNLISYPIPSYFTQSCCYSSTKNKLSDDKAAISHDVTSSIEETIIKNTKKSKSKRILIPAVSSLNEDDATLELQRLNEEINRNDVLYYEDDDPVISDAAYDKMVQRAVDITGRYPHLRRFVSKLDHIGAKKSAAFRDYDHVIPMKSLKNAFTDDDMKKFYDDCDPFIPSSSADDNVARFVTEPKIDGLSLSLRYDDGILVAAGTRGDGHVGEDVTDNVHHIINIPRQLDHHILSQLLSTSSSSSSSSKVEIRGEVYIPIEVFDAMNQERMQQDEKVFSTPRNAAAGSLRTINPQPHRLQQLRFFAYMMLHQPTSSSSASSYDHVCESQTSTLSSLSLLGFDVADGHMTANSIDEVISSCHHIEDYRISSAFELDGAVVKVNSMAAQQLIGDTSKYTKHSIAYKFTAKTSSTIIEDIIIQVGRTGVLTPVAVLQPVMIGGVMISRASLHNEEEVNRLGVHKGARVIVKRAGDVIPKVVSLDHHHMTSSSSSSSSCEAYKLPEHCPVCGSQTQRDNGSYVTCTGRMTCSAQAVEAIGHFCSRDALDIRGLGPARIEELYHADIVNSIADIYRMRSHDQASSNITSSNNTSFSQEKDAISSLRSRKGWGDKSVNNLLAAIDKQRTVPFYRFLYGLGVRHIGTNTAKLIAKEFRSFKSFWEYLLSQTSSTSSETSCDDVQPAAMDRLLAIDGIGPMVVQSLMIIAQDEKWRSLIQELMQVLDIIDDHSVIASTSSMTSSSGDSTTTPPSSFTDDMLSPPSSSASMSISQPWTGRVMLFTGAKVADKFTADVNVLVSASGEDATSSKATKAKKLGIEIWSEKQFIEHVK